jgi:Fe-S cluster biogenesis protein NfuA
MMTFRIQGTPNPKARKYLIDRDLKTSGKVTYKNAKECVHIPMAQALFAIAGVEQIHFFENVVTVTQGGFHDWGTIDQKVQESILAFIEGHDAGFVDFLDAPKNEKPANWTPMMERIDKMLDEMIRPSLQMDGGDIEILEFADNVLTIRYMGACGGCPSSMSGTLEAIRSIVKDEIHQDIEIVAI